MADEKAVRLAVLAVQFLERNVSGCVRRSRISAGKTARLRSASMATGIVSTKAKYCSLSSPAMAKADTTVTWPSLRTRASRGPASRSRAPPAGRRLRGLGTQDSRRIAPPALAVAAGTCRWVVHLGLGKGHVTGG